MPRFDLTTVVIENRISKRN